MTERVVPGARWMPVPPLVGGAWVVFCMLALMALSWTPGAHMVRTGILSGHEEHFLAYFLSAVTIAGVRAAPLSTTGLALVLYASFVEMGQVFVPGRHPAIEDFGASALGALAGVCIALA